MSADRLSVGTLWPAHFSTERFLALVGEVSRPVGVASAFYQESPEARGARRAGASPEELAPLLGALDAPALAVLGDAEVLLALDLPSDVWTYAPRLRFVQSIAAGVSHYDLFGLARAGIALSTSAGVSAPAIAEFALARILQVQKGLRELDAAQSARVWATPRALSGNGDGRLLDELVLGVIGLGAIGKAVARRAHALGMTVVATRRRPDREAVPHYVETVLGPEGLGTLLERSDVVVVAAAETDGTRHLLGRAELERLRPGAVVCNVARGTLVDEAALADALTSGQVGAAVLDVTEVEPLPPASPLWSTPNTYLSPHISALHDRMIDATVELFAGNVVRYARGEPPLNLADPLAGY